MISEPNFRRKRLGQFNTGTRLSRLLAVLSNANLATSVIDPMAGDGDMLESIYEISKQRSIDLIGIEIDPNVAKKCSHRLSSAKIFSGNAFDPKVICRIPHRTYDLVQTNPPYVRYQSTSESETDQNGLQIPSAKEIRKELFNICSKYKFSDLKEKEFFLNCIKDYSGLADLAVPSWLLCAILTKPGGTLAMVVPEAWLRRDYADVIREMLNRYFNIKYIVEDIHSNWFPDALIKTNLVIAKRISSENHTASNNAYYQHIELSSEASNSKSLVGTAFPTHSNPENYLMKAVSSRKNLPSTIRVIDMSINSPFVIKTEQENNIPSIISNVVDKISPVKTLTDYGVIIGQGLRTGANRFFYTDIIENKLTITKLELDPIWEMNQIQVSKSMVLPVLRRQSELINGFFINSNLLSGRVLIINPDHKLNKDLKNYISRVEQTNIGTLKNPIFVPQLSAVSPNERPKVGRHWYMLPNLTLRHRPDLVLPRLNGAHPRTYMNIKRQAVVDANFITIWDGPDSFALLSLLNSTWCVSNMEAMGSVFGGGALKLEATHLRRLPVPIMKDGDWAYLMTFGKHLANGRNDVLKDIDDLVFQRLGISEKKRNSLQNICKLMLEKRSKRYLYVD